MKHCKEVIIPQRVEKHVDFCTCDYCGEVIDDKEDGFDAHEIEVCYTTGSRYPEGSFGEKLTFDFCKKCFTNLVDRLAK